MGEVRRSKNAQKHHKRRAANMVDMRRADIVSSGRDDNETTIEMRFEGDERGSILTPLLAKERGASSGGGGGVCETPVTALEGNIATTPAAFPHILGGGGGCAPAGSNDADLPGKRPRLNGRARKQAAILRGVNLDALGR